MKSQLPHGIPAWATPVLFFEVPKGQRAVYRSVLSIAAKIRPASGASFSRYGRSRPALGRERLFAIRPQRNLDEVGRSRPDPARHHGGRMRRAAGAGCIKRAKGSPPIQQSALCISSWSRIPFTRQNACSEDAGRTGGCAMVEGGTTSRRLAGCPPANAL
jgi:hypothetical protein